MQPVRRAADVRKMRAESADELACETTERQTEIEAGQ